MKRLFCWAFGHTRVQTIPNQPHYGICGRCGVGVMRNVFGEWV